MAQQKSLLLLEPKGSFAVGTTEIPKPGPGELLVKIQAAALNPADWKMQKYDFFVTSYPAVLGSDAAGIVEEPGEGVTDFVKGDRVLFEGWVTNVNATFQQYTIVPAEIAAKLPSKMSFDDAASIPSGLTTAAFGLYNEPGQSGASGGVGLTPPWVTGGRGKYAGQPILILGGGTSVGQFVIQLAKLSGFSPIITTASPHNTPFLTSLGATHVIDRRASFSTLQSSISSLSSSSLQIVYDAVSFQDTQQAGYDLLAPGGSMVQVLSPSIKTQEDSGKKIIHVFGATQDPNQRESGKSLFSKLTEMLEVGDVKPNRVEVLPNGLHGIIDGLKRLEEDAVSGHKLIAHPQETV